VAGKNSKYLVNAAFAIQRENYKTLNYHTGQHWDIYIYIYISWHPKEILKTGEQRAYQNQTLAFHVFHS
jgi:hypothetical protein